MIKFVGMVVDELKNKLQEIQASDNGSELSHGIEQGLALAIGIVSRMAINHSRQQPRAGVAPSLESRRLIAHFIDSSETTPDDFLTEIAVPLSPVVEPTESLESIETEMARVGTEADAAYKEYSFEMKVAPFTEKTTAALKRWIALSDRHLELVWLRYDKLKADGIANKTGGIWP